MSFTRRAVAVGIASLLQFGCNATDQPTAPELPAGLRGKLLAQANSLVALP